MFEERFGRFPTTALLALAGLGVAIFFVTLIYDDLAAPLYALLKEPGGPSIPSGFVLDLVAAATAAAVAGALGCAFLAAHWALYRRRLSAFEKLERKVSQKLEELRELEAEWERRRPEYASALEQADAAHRNAEQVAKIMKEILAEVDKATQKLLQTLQNSKAPPKDPQA